MAAELDVTGLFWAAAILSIPILLALPMRVAWRFFIGIGHEESQYRNSVRQIIDAGRQVSPFRTTLDDLARGLHIQPSRQRLIEADLFHPLTLSHFLLLRHRRVVNDLLHALQRVDDLDAPPLALAVRLHDEVPSFDLRLAAAVELFSF